MANEPSVLVADGMLEPARKGSTETMGARGRMRRSGANGRLVPTYDPRVGRRRVVLERGMRICGVPAGDVNHVAGGGDRAAVPGTIRDPLACKAKSVSESEHGPSADAALSISRAQQSAGQDGAGGWRT